MAMYKFLGFMGVCSLGGLGYLKYFEYSKINSELEQLLEKDKLSSHLHQLNEDSAFSIDSTIDAFERSYNQFSVNKYRETLAGLCEGRVLEPQPEVLQVGDPADPAGLQPVDGERGLRQGESAGEVRLPGGRCDEHALRGRLLRLRAGHLRAGVRAQPAPGAGRDPQGVPARRARAANERGNLQHRRVPLLGEHQVGVQFDEGRLLLQPQLGKTRTPVQLRGRAHGTQEERQTLHVRPPQRQNRPILARSVCHPLPAQLSCPSPLPTIVALPACPTIAALLYCPLQLPTPYCPTTTTILLLHFLPGHPEFHSLFLPEQPTNTCPPFVPTPSPPSTYIHPQSLLSSPSPSPSPSPNHLTTRPCSIGSRQELMRR